MSREIKFRIWNSETKKWMSDTSCVSRSNNSITFNLNKNLIASQFTGLKDKNGKEIFEGDIVEFYYQGNTITCQIVFDNAAFKLKWKDGYINTWKLNTDRYSVIGNIFEHPRL